SGQLHAEALAQGLGRVYTFGKRKLRKSEKSGETPFVLLDYFPEGFLTIIDESHITIPQLRAMYNTDRRRKETL
ncbi:35914_t:CDS:2, partial [Gigaspora margarita]